MRMSFQERRTRMSSKMSEIVPDLTWDVVEKEVTSGGTIAPEYKAIHRSDTNDRFSIVSQSYKVATNAKLVDMASRLATMTGLKIEGYSWAGKGERVVAYLKNNLGGKFGPWQTENYMALGNSFDTTTSLWGGNVTKVMRCSNEFSRIKRRMNIRHSSTMDVKIEEMMIMFENYMMRQRELEETMVKWQDITMYADQKDIFADTVLEIIRFDTEKQEKVEVSARKQNQFSELMASINSEIEATGNNLYSYFNGVTHYTTHKAGSSRTPRLFGNVIGTLANVNERAYDACESYELATAF